MRWLIVFLAAALAPGAAWSAEQRNRTTQAPGGGPGQGQGQDGAQDDRTYGQYGNDPGTESKSDAKQASDPERARSRAGQDERRAGGAPAAGTLRGRIVKATPEGLALRGEDERLHRLRVTERTEVRRGQRRVAIADLREGEEVRASVAGSGERRVATRIVVGEDATRQPASVGDKEREDARRLRGDRSGGDREEKPGLTR